MNFDEFKTILGADPGCQDEEFLRARDSAPEFRQAWEKAQAFERMLESAVRAEPPRSAVAALNEQLARIPASDLLQDAARQPAANAPRWRVWSIAAGTLLAVGAVVIGLNMPRGWSSVDEYLAEHYEYDGAKVMAMAGTASQEQVRRALARFEWQAPESFLQQVLAFKDCPTPDGSGLHMILATESGPVTLILMPRVPVEDGRSDAITGMSSFLVTLDTGSAALIGPDEDQLASLSAALRDAIRPS